MIDARNFERIVDLALDAGWRVADTKQNAVRPAGRGRKHHGHALLYPPDPGLAPVGISTSNDRRAARNAYAALRRAGLETDPARITRTRPASPDQETTVPTPPAEITPQIAHQTLFHYQEGGYPAGSFITALLDLISRADPAGSFITALLDLISRADPTNQYKLSLGFPAHVAAVQLGAVPGGIPALRAIAERIGATVR